MKQADAKWAEEIVAGRPVKQKLPPVLFIIKGDFAGLRGYPLAIGQMNGKDLALCKVEMKEGYWLFDMSEVRKA